MELICSCRNEINQSRITHETEYSQWGWFLFTVLGLSAKPKVVKFLCMDCGKVVKSSSEEAILKKFVGR